jgi:hypothetical protein
MKYIESYKVGNRVYGIADKGKNGKFRCWVLGCCVGTHDTLPSARQHLHSYAVGDQTKQRKEAVRALDEATKNLERLGDDPFYLGRFTQGKPNG